MINLILKKDVVLISNNTIIDTLFVNEKKPKNKSRFNHSYFTRNENLILKKEFLKLIELLKSLDRIISNQLVYA